MGLKASVNIDLFPLATPKTTPGIVAKAMRNGHRRRDPITITTPKLASIAPTARTICTARLVDSPKDSQMATLTRACLEQLGHQPLVGEPRRLLDAGFEFRYPDLQQAVEALVGRPAQDVGQVVPTGGTTRLAK